MSVKTTVSLDKDDPKVRAARDAEQTAYEHHCLDRSEHYSEIAEWETRFRVVEVGDGPPSVLIMGGEGKGMQWLPVLPELDGFTLYLMDRLGAGLSDGIDYRSAPLREIAARSTLGLFDHFGLESAPVIGNSMGGLWTLRFALAQPNQVKKIAFVGAPAGLTPKIPIPLRLAGTPIIGELLFKTALGHSKENYRRQLQNYVVDPDNVPPELVEATYQSMSAPSVRRSFKTMVQEVTTLGGFKSDYVLREQLGDVEQPTLFVWGRDDPVHPVSAGRRAAGRLSNARFELVAEAGHYVWLDAPERTESLLMDFLG